MSTKIQEREHAQNSRVKKREIAVVCSGYGTNEIRLGQTERQAKAVLGMPDKRIRKHKGYYFFIYLKRGMDLDFGKRGGKLKFIFFFRNGVYEHDQAKIITDRGVRLGDSRSRVLELYGEPDQMGDACILHNGNYFREWFYYSAGIQFSFSRNHKVDEISVSRRKRKLAPRKKGAKQLDRLKKTETDARKGRTNR
jgi:hypothetical protein